LILRGYAINAVNAINTPQKPITAFMAFTAYSKGLKIMPTLTERARAHRDTAQAVPTAYMTLSQFAHSRRVVVIYSDVLGEEVLFAADNARLPETETRPVYRARELAVIWGEDGSISADGLRLLHEVKTRFAGDVTSDISDQTEERPEA